MSATTKETLTRLEHPALNQDPLGKAADRIVRDGDLEIWACLLVGGSQEVGPLWKLTFSQ